MLLPLWGTQEQGRSMAQICGIRADEIPNAQLDQRETWSKCVDVSGLFPLMCNPPNAAAEDGSGIRKTSRRLSDGLKVTQLRSPVLSWAAHRVGGSVLLLA